VVVIGILLQIARQAAVIPIASLERSTELEDPMKTWNKPQVREQEVGLEVTSYLPAEIDVI
jgi:coenzyme PQQ precursor peptide PqqA